MPTEKRVRSSYIATAAHEARRLIRTYEDVWLILKEIFIWLGRVMYLNVDEMVGDGLWGVEKMPFSMLTHKRFCINCVAKVVYEAYRFMRSNVWLILKESFEGV